MRQRRIHPHTGNESSCAECAEEASDITSTTHMRMYMYFKC